MQLFLEVMSGPYQGKKIEAGIGRVVRIGRTTQSDIALEDNFLSGVHFAIECDLRSCRLRDMNSRNGTKVNGMVVTEATLKDGDQVHAGRTDFVVRIEDPLKTLVGFPPPEAAASGNDRHHPAKPKAIAPEQRSPLTQATPATEVDEQESRVTARHEQAAVEERLRLASITQSPASAALPPVIESKPVVGQPEINLPTGLDSYEAATPEGRLLQILSNQPVPLMALIDAAHDARVLKVLRGSSEEYQSLYRGDQNAAIAPYLVKLPPRSELLKQMIREGWGQNWGVYLTCPFSLPELREHLRQSLMVTMPDGMELFSRFYDPRFFRAFLETCSAAEAEKFFGPITSYLMEDERPEILLQYRRSRTGAEKKGHLLTVLS